MMRTTWIHIGTGVVHSEFEIDSKYDKFRCTKLRTIKNIIVDEKFI